MPPPPPPPVQDFQSRWGTLQTELAAEAQERAVVQHKLIASEQRVRAPLWRAGLWRAGQGGCAWFVPLLSPSSSPSSSRGAALAGVLYMCCACVWRFPPCRLWAWRRGWMWRCGSGSACSHRPATCRQRCLRPSCLCRLLVKRRLLSTLNAGCHRRRRIPALPMLPPSTSTHALMLCRPVCSPPLAPLNCPLQLLSSQRERHYLEGNLSALAARLQQAHHEAADAFAQLTALRSRSAFLEKAWLAALDAAKVRAGPHARAAAHSAAWSALMDLLCACCGTLHAWKKCC